MTGWLARFDGPTMGATLNCGGWHASADWLLAMLVQRATPPDAYRDARAVLAAAMPDMPIAFGVGGYTLEIKVGP